MKLAVKGTSIRLVEDTSLVANREVSYPVEFIFDESWDGASRTALFKAGGDAVSVRLTDDKCIIPSECLKQAGVWLQVAVSGSIGGVDIFTGWCSTSIIMYRATIDLSRGGDCCGGGSGLPDDSYDRIMGVIGDLSAAGFEGKTLVEVIVNVQKDLSETAADEEVDRILDEVFGKRP